MEQLVANLPIATDEDSGEWSEIIEPQTHLLDLRLNDVWRYRDLVMLFVRRDFVSNYKQTILGPLWFFIQPILTTLTYVVIFGNIAKLSTDGTPMLVFYMAGTTVWGYFSQTLTSIASVFTVNAQLFGKVYFPRLTMPLSIVIANLVRFGIQFGLFLIIWTFYLIKGGTLHPNWLIALTPVLVAMMGLQALGLGMVISALTTKYRDLALLLTFGVQLLMYAAPVVYPLSKVPAAYKWLILANPVSAVLETFRYAFTGAGTFAWTYLLLSLGTTLLILLLGTIIFNRVEKSFTDTV